MSATTNWSAPIVGERGADHSNITEDRLVEHRDSMSLSQRVEARRALDAAAGITYLFTDWQVEEFADLFAGSTA